MARTIVVNCKYQPYDILIDRTTFLGNPYIIGKDGDRTEVINKFKTYFYNRLCEGTAFRRAVERHRGKRLGCHCKPRPCHGDIIVEYLEDEGSVEVTNRELNGALSAIQLTGKSTSVKTLKYTIEKLLKASLTRRMTSVLLPPMLATDIKSLAVNLTQYTKHQKRFIVLEKDKTNG